MGNIVQCCHSLSNYFKCKDAPTRGEAERSPLLSSEESECESPSLPDDFEDDLLTVSTGVTNPTLEPEHFLFPDIILSSNLGGEMTLVEPMVCLLVSEEEEGVRVDEPGDEGQERSNRGKNRGYSEVETQTEVETQIGMGVQTQTESHIDVQAQAEIPVCNSETVKKEADISLTNTRATNEMVVDVLKECKILKQVDMFLEAQTDSQIVTKMPSEKQKKRIDSGKNKLDLRDIHMEAEQEELAVQENTSWTERLTLQTRDNVRDKDQNTENTSVMLTEHNVNSTTEIVENFDPVECHVDLTQQSKRDNEQIADHDIIRTQKHINLSEDHTDQSERQFFLNAEPIQCQENLQPPKREEDDDKTGLQHVLELETAVPQGEMKQMTLFSVDRLFLAVSFY